MKLITLIGLMTVVCIAGWHSHQETQKGGSPRQNVAETHTYTAELALDSVAGKDYLKVHVIKPAEQQDYHVMQPVPNRSPNAVARLYNSTAGYDLTVDGWASFKGTHPVGTTKKVKAVAAATEFILQILTVNGREVHRVINVSDDKDDAGMPNVEIVKVYCQSDGTKVAELKRMQYVEVGDTCGPMDPVDVVAGSEIDNFIKGVLKIAS